MDEVNIHLGISSDVKQPIWSPRLSELINEYDYWSFLMEILDIDA